MKKELANALVVTTIRAFLTDCGGWLTEDIRDALTSTMNKMQDEIRDELRKRQEDKGNG